MASKKTEGLQLSQRGATGVNRDCMDVLAMVVLGNVVRRLCGLGGHGGRGKRVTIVDQWSKKMHTNSTRYYIGMLILLTNWRTFGGSAKNEDNINSITTCRIFLKK